MDPIVELGVCEAMFVALDEVAVVDDYCVEITPLGHVLGQGVFFPDLGLSLFYFMLDGLY